jgi:hypothetical protein
MKNASRRHRTESVACRLASCGASTVHVLLLVVSACGSSQPEAEETAPVEHATSGAEFTPPRAGMQVSGLMGTIPQRKILATLEPKLPAFARCFARGAAEVAPIAGSMELYFRVALDGHVEWVYPRTSNVGHRATERCVLDAAAAARFPGPKGGGAAELAWSFEMEAGDVRPPVEWDAANVVVAAEQSREVLDACGVTPGDATLTLYVAPGGTVVGAGGAARTREAAERLDCLIDAARIWILPDPGEHLAKVSFPAP